MAGRAAPEGAARRSPGSAGALRAEWYAVVVDAVRRLARCGAGGCCSRASPRWASSSCTPFPGIRSAPHGCGDPAVVVPRFRCPRHASVHRDGPPPAPPPAPAALPDRVSRRGRPGAVGTGRRVRVAPPTPSV
ncbi:hypothetical protein ACE1SV_59710 [Streptomyces sp. E-15]